VALLFAPARAEEAAHRGGPPKAAAAAPAGKQPEGPGQIQAQPPPFSEGIFPCSQCHPGPGDAKRRELAFHDEIQSTFTHDSENRWCLDCHDNANRDMLHLSSGSLLTFAESYRLCGQCHGDKYRDWRAGVHGKRVGMWDGSKTYFLCVNCHNPHSPRFRAIVEVELQGKKASAPSLTPMKPEPRPTRPEEMRR
jgi:hypothetical protein